MVWYNYVTVFFAALFLTNAVPHFVKGICGDPFPTPFSKPPGKGLSSPVVNVIWGGANFIIGFVLYKVSKASLDDIPSLIVMFATMLLFGAMMANNFKNKDKAD